MKLTSLGYNVAGHLYAHPSTHAYCEALSSKVPTVKPKLSCRSCRLAPPIHTGSRSDTEPQRLAHRGSIQAAAASISLHHHPQHVRISSTLVEKCLTFEFDEEDKSEDWAPQRAMAYRVANGIPASSSSVASLIFIKGGQGGYLTETRNGSYIYDGPPARFHEWEFRTRMKVQGRTDQQYPTAMSHVIEGLRGDAFLIAQEISFQCIH